MAAGLTGRSYKDDQETMMVGLSLQMELGKYKQELLEQGDDSYLNMKFADHKRIMLDLGFEVILEDHFESNWTDITEPEVYQILWRDGILVTMESFGGESASRNSAKMYYNFKADNANIGSQLMSSSRMLQVNSRNEVRGYNEWVEGDPVIVVGDHDIREGTRHTLRKIWDNAEFLSKWVEQPHLWLVHYGETKTFGSNYRHYDEITEGRVARLPEHVREAITP
jgi:hypothetical protein